MFGPSLITLVMLAADFSFCFDLVAFLPAVGGEDVCTMEDWVVRFPIFPLALGISSGICRPERPLWFLRCKLADFISVPKVAFLSDDPILVFLFAAMLCGRMLFISLLRSALELWLTVNFLLGCDYLLGCCSGDTLKPSFSSGVYSVEFGL